MDIHLVTLPEYVEKLKKILDHNDRIFLESNDNYLNLSHAKEIQPETLSNNTTLPPQPLSEAFTLLLTALEQKNIDRLTLGTNEILKTMLRLLQEDNQKRIAEIFLKKIEQLFAYTVMPGFPYSPDYWDFLCSCFEPVGKYLITNNFQDATKVYLALLGRLGKRAAVTGLHTDRLQHCLRTLEIKTEIYNLEELEQDAKNQRHNLEV